ncbi:hypothetical protein L7F22_031340 [Adiantum nelumboides]|nr:hypothetical protein [Adiantum nelumboides]
MQDALQAEHINEPVHDTSMLHRQVEWDCSSEPQLEAVRMSSHRHGKQVESLDAHGEASCMVAEMTDLEADDALIVQPFLDACMFEQSSELVVQESMPDRHVEPSCSRDAQQCQHFFCPTNAHEKSCRKPDSSGFLFPQALLKQKIRIQKSYWVDRIEEATKLILNAARSTEREIMGPLPSPTRRPVYCVLRSPHVNKNS